MAVSIFAHARPRRMLSRQLSASVVEGLAKAIAVLCGLLNQTQHLAELPQPFQHQMRLAARLALGDRTIHDAELWARDEYAQAEFGKTFNALTVDQQSTVYQRVHNIARALELYLSGDVEPMNAWRREQVQPGATTAPLMVVLPRTNTVQ